MGLWRNIARLARAGSVQGVVEPGPTDVLTPAQAVQVLDDVSHAVQPLAVPVSIHSALSPAVALRLPAVRIQAGPRGTLIRSLYGQNAGATASSNVNTFAIFDPAVDALANETIAPPVLVLGGTATHRVFTGDLVDPISLFMFIEANKVGAAIDLYLEPDESIGIGETQSPNVVRVFNLIIQDIP